MVNNRAIIRTMVLAPVMLVVTGCMNARLPAIDPSGRRIFLPSPNFTTVAQDGPLTALLHGRRLGVPRTPPTTGPYEPALLNRHRGSLSRLFHREQTGASALPFSSSPGGRAFTTPPQPPLCGPDGLAPDGSPCYPIGSPSASSLAATLPGGPGIVGSGVVPNSQRAGVSRFAQLGPGVVLAQRHITARVGDEVIVVGGVQSSTGVARPGEPVRWSLSNDSVGTIIDATRPSGVRSHRLLGFLQPVSARTAAARIGCGDCVQSVTSNRCDVLVRNPVDPTDDIHLARGQSWVSLTSGSEGTSYVTLAAPQLQGRRHVTARVDWIDASWSCPKPVLSSLEGPGRLVTEVGRNSDKAPLVDWIVRYRFLDGPSASLGMGDSAQVVDVPTDSSGRSSIDVYPLSTQSGTTRIAIEVIDPSRRLANPVGRCIGYVTWSESAPVIPLPKSSTAEPPSFDDPLDSGTSTPTDTQPPIGTDPPFETSPPISPPPQSATLSIFAEGRPELRIGDTATYGVTVSNGSSVPATDVLVWLDTPPPALEFDRSTPQAYVDRAQIVWDIGFLPANQTRTIQAEFKVQDVDDLALVFKAEGRNATRVDSEARSRVTGPTLEVEVSPPEPFVPVVGREVTFRIRVFNHTNRRREVELGVDSWSDGIAPQARGSAVATRGITLPDSVSVPPRSWSQWEQLPFDVREAGPQEFRATATDVASGERVEDRGLVTVRAAPELTMNMQADPSPVTAGATTMVTLVFKNTGGVPLTNARLVFFGDPDLWPIAAQPEFSSSDGGRILTAPVQPIGLGQGLSLQFECRALPNPGKRSARLRARMLTDQGEFETQPLDIDIVEQGESPVGRRTSFQRRARPSRDTLQVGIETSARVARKDDAIDYQILVENTHNEGFRDVQVTMEVGEGVQFTAADGPPGTESRLTANRLLLDFSAVREILPNEKLLFRARATPSVTGPAKLIGTVRAIGLPRPVIVVAETLVH